MRSDKPEKKAQTRAWFERLSKEFGDLKSAYGKDYKSIAAGFLFELDHLQIGQIPPDFEAIDENGVKFKLSDYRGKVVVLDFWGFW
ncbi:MAG: redoxin domain-containing protein [Planctomycetes bacterium]|nr:redoxin domain-containing protein [Planctomycetota bacterium]